MTFAFLIAGACELATGLALRPAASAGWLVLTAGGAAGMLVAASLEPAGGGSSVRHTVAAVAGPGSSCGVADRGPAAGALGAMGTAAGRFGRASAVLLALLLWFGAELVTGAGQADLAERVMGALQAPWPLLVVLSCYRSQFPGQAPATCLLGAGMRGEAHRRAGLHHQPCRHRHEGSRIARQDLPPPTGEGPRAWKTTPPGRDAPQPHAPWAAPR